MVYKNHRANEWCTITIEPTFEGKKRKKMMAGNDCAKFSKVSSYLVELYKTPMELTCEDFWKKF